MTRISTLQPSFAAGELSPRLYGRVDLQKYAAGAEAIENFIVRPEGGLMRRHGTRFAGETRNHAMRARLIPFVFSTVQAYMLEFGDRYIRFWKDFAPITSSSAAITQIAKANPAVVSAAAHGFANGDRVIITGASGMGEVNNREFTVANRSADAFELSGVDSSAYDAYSAGGTAAKIHEIASPYAAGELEALYVSQSADTLYIAHPAHAPRTLTRTGHTSWSLTALALERGPFATMNGDDSLRVMCQASGHQPGDAVSVKASGAIFTPAHAGSHLFLREIYLDQAAVSPWASTIAIATALGTQVSSSGHVYELVNAGTGSSTGSVIPSHTEGDAWDNPTGGSGTNTKKWRYLHSRWAIVRLDSFIDSKNMSGAVVTYLCNGLAPAAKTISNVSEAAGLARVTANAHGYNEGDHVAIAGVGGAVQANGDWRIVNVTTNTFDLAGSAAPSAYSAGGNARRYATWLWALGAFSSAHGFPAAVALHEQRLVFANTRAQPFGLWASATADFANFLPGSRDDETIAYNIAANQADPIRWMTSGPDLSLGTLSQEFAAGGGGLGDPITPSNLRVVPQSGEGSNGVQAVKAGRETLFVNRSGRKLIALSSETDSGLYAASDLTELAEHLTRTAPIVRLAWAKNPASLMWALLADGTLIAMTYRPEQQIYAWARQPMNGFVESIATIASPDGASDDLWLIVRRTIQGQTRRTVEFLAPPFEPAHANDKALMGYLDGALRYQGTPAGTLSGLFHLEGETVQIVADGALHPQRVVAGGRIALERPAANVWAGLGYTSRLRTLRLEAPVLGSAQGKTKRVARVTVRVHQGIGGRAGPGDESRMEELVRRDLSDAMDASPPIRAGDFDIHPASDFDLDGRLAVVQDEPMPLDLLGLTAVLSVDEA